MKFVISVDSYFNAMVSDMDIIRVSDTDTGTDMHHADFAETITIFRLATAYEFPLVVDIRAYK